MAVSGHPSRPDNANPEHLRTLASVNELSAGQWPYPLKGTRAADDTLATIATHDSGHAVFFVSSARYSAAHRFHAYRSRANSVAAFDRVSSTHASRSRAVTT